MPHKSKNLNSMAVMANHGGDTLDMSYQRWILKQMEKRCVRSSILTDNIRHR